MDMFFGASPEMFSRAKSLRNNMTNSEKVFWQLVREGIRGHKFRRQHPMGPYIADFYCHSLKLVIELDGKHHYEDNYQEEIDKQRDSDMRKWGIRVIRYKNEIDTSTVLHDIEKLISQNEINNATANPHPNPPTGGYNRT